MDMSFDCDVLFNAHDSRDGYDPGFEAHIQFGYIHVYELLIKDRLRFYLNFIVSIYLSIIPTVYQKESQRPKKPEISSNKNIIIKLIFIIPI